MNDTLKQFLTVGSAILALVAALERNTQATIQLVELQKSEFEERRADLQARRNELDLARIERTENELNALRKIAKHVAIPEQESE